MRTKKVIDKMWDSCDKVSEIYWQKLKESIADIKAIEPLYQFLLKPKRKRYGK